MRVKRTALAAVITLSAFGALTAPDPAREPSAPILRFDSSGCPAKPYEPAEIDGRLPYPVWSRFYLRGLARDGADYALLCRTSGFEESSWLDPLRITRGVKELQRVMDALPRADPDTISDLVGYPAYNLVLHYPDGRRTVIAFEFDRDEVASYRAIRLGASQLTSVFARLWRAEHVSPDPSKIAPPTCLPSLPDLRNHSVSDPAPAIVRGFAGSFWGGASIESGLPSPLAVVRACRYTADARGRLTLRAHNDTRTDLEPLRTAVNARKPPENRLRCGDPEDPKITSLDVLYLTDVTGRSDRLYILRKPCTAEEGMGIGGVPVTPETSATLSRLLPE